MTTLVIREPHTVWTHIVLRHPLHRTIVPSVTSELCQPAPPGFVIVGITNLGAGSVIEVPPGLVSDHLVVVIVEEAGST